jgi:molybdenum cofactor sulfurtransferase
MLKNLYGNPHSASAASQLTTRRIEDIRLRVLRFFGADPEDFDVMFVQNATAGVKLVVEGLRGYRGGSLGYGSRGEGRGFWYGYHRDSHTSLVGAREAARAGQRCFKSDEEVESWLSGGALDSTEGCGDGAEAEIRLFAYPAQSNMTGRRLPLNWPGRLRRSQLAQHRIVHSMLDAAALVSTSPLDLSNPEEAPDFTVLSFYKIFGFPDLGALIVRKEVEHVLRRRDYFGGGTVEMVVCLKEQWHERKQGTLHDQLEDGTIPFHNIIALDLAMDVHRQLYGSMESISEHTSALAKSLYEGLSRLVHGNGEPVCRIYKEPSSVYGDGKSQGPIIAFNIMNSSGAWVSNAEVERLAAIRNIQLRTGGVCNPGGTAYSLGLAPWEMKANFSAGKRCGDENDVMGGKPTGVLRVSIGAMSSGRDVAKFQEFVEEFFAEEGTSGGESTSHLRGDAATATAGSEPDFYVESLTIYPIKSCGGWRIPTEMPWEVRREGLAWDREWCLVHLGTGIALSMKRYPKMALVHPMIDLEDGILRVRLSGSLSETSTTPEVTVPLSANPEYFSQFKTQTLRVCGDDFAAHTYTSPLIAGFFSDALGVPCTLARFPAGTTGNLGTTRYSKAKMREFQGLPNGYSREPCNSDGMPGAFPGAAAVATEPQPRQPILLSNESPILLVSRSSLNKLNREIVGKGGKKVEASVFRGNVVVAERGEGEESERERPYVEDRWKAITIGGVNMEVYLPTTYTKNSVDLTLILA